MNILITGGSGFIGSELIKSLAAKQQHSNITVLTRKKHHRIYGVHNITDNLESIANYEKIDVIINLAGAPIDRIWTKNYKKVLISSRLDTTHALIKLIKRLDTKPELLLSASAIGYYGPTYGQEVSEESIAHESFMHELCDLWEKAANEAEQYGVRVCNARLGVVLGRKGGMLAKILVAFKMFLGGKLGSGNQYLSWIHEKDLIRAFDELIQNKNLSGAFNICSPEPVTNEHFTKILGKLLNRPVIFPAPKALIQFVFQEMGEHLLLASQRAIPKRLLDLGFKFEYPDIESALMDLV